MDEKKLSGRVALVTGGTSGIGKGTALLFAKEGAMVAFTGRREELGRRVVAQIEAEDGRVIYIPADHTRPEDCQRAVDEAVRTFGGLDILINNAGIVLDGNAEGTSEEDWHYALELNVTAVWRMSRLVLPHMRTRGKGVIVNIASDWGLVGAPGALAYCTCKGAVINLTRAMALDHARENIRINAVCPGDTFVERWLYKGYYEGSGAVTRETIKQEAAKEMPIGRVAEVDEIARAVLFLASDDSSFMVGATLAVDGGNTAR